MEFTAEQTAEIENQIQAAVKAATQGLVSKKEELEKKISKRNQELADAEKAKADELERAEQTKLEEAGKLNELIERLREQINTQKTEHETLVKKLSDEKVVLDTNMRVLIGDNELTKQFVAVGVDDPDLLEAAVALHKDKVEINTDEDGKMVAVLGDGSIEDYVKGWAEGKGKAFISNGNAGGGGKPSKQGGTDEYEVHFKPETRNLTKQNELQQSDPERYKALKDKYNQSDTRLSALQ